MRENIYKLMTFYSRITRCGSHLKIEAEGREAVKSNPEVSSFSNWVLHGAHNGGSKKEERKHWGEIIGSTKGMFHLKGLRKISMSSEKTEIWLWSFRERSRAENLLRRNKGSFGKQSVLELNIIMEHSRRDNFAILVSQIPLGKKWWFNH